MKKLSIIKQGAVALCLFVMSACGAQSAQQPQQQSYATEVVVAQDMTINRKYSAAIRGRQDIDIYAQVAGTITKVCVTEGQSVKRG